METKQPGISGYWLKLIAVISMLIDHTSAVILEQIPGLENPAFLMRIIGRLAFPIYCFLLVEGFYHTRSRAKYAGRLFLFALISEVPFDLAFSRRMWDFSSNNVFFTLLFGLLVIWGVEGIKQKFVADVYGEKAAAIRRNSVHQFIFRIFDALQGVEGVQMLRADARQHAVTRMHQSTQFLDIPDVPSAHFRHKHLRRGRQALTDDFRHAHWRIEAARRNQCLILLLQNRAKNELDARLAVAAGNADFDDVRARRQFLLRVAEIHFAHELLNRPRQQSTQRHPERQQQRQ